MRARPLPVTSKRMKSMQVVHTTLERSRLMAAVRQKGTEPELVVRRLLRKHKIPFRTNRTSLPGSPDVVTRMGVAIFIHGCFWHGHSSCRYASVPKSNSKFWRAKFRRNKERDASNERQLRAIGYRIKTIWACQLKNPKSVKRVENQLTRIFVTLPRKKK